jgi:hypothetical protein
MGWLVGAVGIEKYATSQKPRKQRCCDRTYQDNHYNHYSLAWLNPHPRTVRLTTDAPSAFISGSARGCSRLWDTALLLALRVTAVETEQTLLPLIILSALYECQNGRGPRLHIEQGGLQ